MFASNYYNNTTYKGRSTTALPSSLFDQFELSSVSSSVPAFHYSAAMYHLSCLVS